MAKAKFQARKLESRVSLVKRFFQIRDKWYLVVANIGLMMLLVILLPQLLSRLFVVDAQTQKFIQDLSAPLGALAAAGLAGLGARIFRGKEDEKWKKVITTLGNVLVSLALVASNLVVGAVNAYVHQPCYGIVPTQQGKTRVLISKFVEKNSANEVEKWSEKLRILMADSVKGLDVEFAQLPETVTKKSEAEMMNRCYRSVLTVWGVEGDDVIEVNYTNSMDSALMSKSQRMGTEDAEILGTSSNVVDMKTFTSYIRRGADTRFVVTVLSGMVASDAAKHEKAIELFTEAIAIAQKTSMDSASLAQVYNDRGFARRRQGDAIKALEDYTEAIRLDPTSPDAYNNRGVEYGRLKKFNEALEDLNQAIKLDPTDAKTYFNRGYMYAKLGKVNLAIQDFGRCVELGGCKRSP